MHRSYNYTLGDAIQGVQSKEILLNIIEVTLILSVPVTLDTSPSVKTGFGLMMNHFVAMFLKKFLSTLRSWILLVLQIAMPSVFVALAIVVAKNQNRTGNLPAMPLDLSKFNPSVTLSEQLGGHDSFTDLYRNLGSRAGYSTDISDVGNISNYTIGLVSIEMFIILGTY